MIYSWSKEGDIVYDMFGGSGTTAKMADLMKRKFVTSEWSEINCKKIQTRFKSYGRDIEIVR
jgi:DNA modification methylase